MVTFLSKWSWLDDGVLPVLIAIVRACWVWPWLLLIQLGVSPGIQEAALPLWSVLLLPILSFTFARWASQQSIDVPKSTAPRMQITEPQLPLFPRLSVALLGIVVAVLIVWWQLYRAEWSLANVAWVERMSDSLIHWPAAAIPPAVVLIASALFLWLRGLLDAGHPLTHDSIWQIFRTGIVMMVLFLVIITMGQLDLVGQLITSVLVMLAAGMGALAFSSVKITAGLDRALGVGVRHIGERESGELGVLPTAAMPIVNRYWFISVAGAIGVLMLGGILLMLLIAPEVMEAMLEVLWTILAFIGDIAALLLLGVAYVASALFFLFYRLIEPYLQRLMERMEIDQEFMEGLQQEAEETTEVAEAIEQAPVPDEYRWLGLLAVGIITLIIFIVAIRRLRSTSVETLDEERESILTADLLQDQLGNLWDRLRNRFRSQDPDDPFLALDGEENRRRIRAVYQSLLVTASENGQSRDAALTPVEYETQLAQMENAPRNTVRSIPQSIEPNAADDANTLRQFYGQRYAAQLERITNGYVAARYGDEVPSAAVAADVEAAWQEIESSLHEETIEQETMEQG